MKWSKKNLKWVLALIFNVFLFLFLYYWLKKNISFHELIHSIKQTHISSILGVIVIYMVVLTFYSLRLSTILKFDFKNSFFLVSINSGFNNLLPFRMGDILRIYFAKKIFNIDVDHIIAATFMERYFDLTLLLLLGSVILLQQPLGLSLNTIYVFTLLLGCSLLGFILYRYLIVVDNSAKKLLCRSERLSFFIKAMEKVFLDKNKLIIFLFSSGVWLGILAAYYSFFKMNLPVTSFDLTGSILLLFTTTLSFAVSYSLAGIGIFESAIVYYLIKHLHVLPSDALALALVFHFATALPQIGLMLIFLVLKTADWIVAFRNLYSRP